MFRAEDMIKQLYRSANSVTSSIDWALIEEIYDILPLRNPKKQNVKVFDDLCLKRVNNKNEFDSQYQAHERTDHVLKPYYHRYNEEFQVIASKNLSEAQSLKTVVEQAKDRNPEKIEPILNQVREAIGALNKLGIQHNDLQADDNILVQDDHVYIIDFELSENVGEEDATKNNLVQVLFGGVDDKQMRETYKDVLAKSTTPDEPQKIVQTRRSVGRMSSSPSKRRKGLTLLF